jgi:hypothetical protein
VRKLPRLGCPPVISGGIVCSNGLRDASQAAAAGHLTPESEVIANRDF